MPLWKEGQRGKKGKRDEHSGRKVPLGSAREPSLQKKIERREEWGGSIH